MKLRKFEAGSEAEAMAMVNAELGADALILNIKKIQPRGLFKFFRKPTVEITAAFDDRSVNPVETPKDPKPVEDIEKDKLLLEQMLKNMKIEEQQSKIDSLEMLIEEMNKKIKTSRVAYSNRDKYENSVLQAFYDAMVSQGVMEEIADFVLKDALAVEENEALDVNLAAKIVYNNIIGIIGHPGPENYEAGGDAKVLVFIGPTGVGKTTTIAKLSSNYILRDNMKVGLITADTYRIAAVEQLRTYAEILDIDVKVVYNHAELEENLEYMRHSYDIICIDTAGRSHRNDQNLEELKDMLDKSGLSKRYLVLSSTTKDEDLLSIIDKYSKMTDFKLILTKLDETLNYGAILNVCKKTGRQVEYITNGQNVPDDIEVMEPEKVAKALLGLGGVL